MTDTPLPLPSPKVWTRYADHGPEGAFTADQMRAYGAACAAAEREACIEAVEGNLAGSSYGLPSSIAALIVERIRARETP